MESDCLIDCPSLYMRCNKQILRVLYIEGGELGPTLKAALV